MIKTDGVKNVGTIDPSLIAESRPRPLLERWQLRSLKDAYTERPPVQYVVEGLLSLPSLSIGYGSPGSLKSMALADMAVCVASGQTWLQPLNQDGPCTGFKTIKSPVFWIDYDNGRLRTDERFDALAKSRGLLDDAPIHYVSMAMPWLDATDGYVVRELVEVIAQLGAKLVVIDNLGLISGDADENSADMVKVMGNLRRLAEDSGAAVVVIHHQRKGNLADRAGDLLRGHTSIEASLDLALLFTRQNQEAKIIIQPTKVRGAAINGAFSAEFLYTHRSGTKELEAARFWGTPIVSKKDHENQQIQSAILTVLRRLKPGETSTQSNVVKDVAGYLEAIMDGKKAGVNRIRGVLAEMEFAGTVATQEGDRGAKLYCIPSVG